jgi:HPt (histidine-containing phosphotransfer) domain-containing protein/GAF domain-containing protein
MHELNSSTERLREVLLDLEHAQRRERELRIQSEALLSGLQALSDATTPEELFSRILEALREPLSFEAAFVLRPSATPQTLVCTAATETRFLGSSWILGKTFTRVLQAGRVVVHLDTSGVSEWNAQPDSIRQEVGSALCIPLRGSLETALLVCTRKETRAFQPSHEQMAKRFQPLATQALRDAERGAEVERANRDMRLVLDTVDQGLLTIDRAMQVVGETSATALAWFGGLGAGDAFPDLLARLSPQVARNFATGWDQVLDGWLPIECALDQLPHQVTSNGRTLALQLSPIGDEEHWTRMLVIVSDMTAALQRERAEERRRELAVIVTRIVRDREGFELFSKETSSMIAALRDGRTTDKGGQLRLLHTLKGNSSVLGLGSLAQIAHELEDQLRDRLLDPGAFTALANQWNELREEFEPILAERGRRGVVVTEGEYEWLIRELRCATSTGHISSVVGEWHNERADVMLGRVAEQARALAARVGKGPASVSVEADDLRLDSTTWSPVFSAMVHAVRNAIDHGLEGEEERVANGKSATSHLYFREKRLADGFSLEIEDDGRGIDWACVSRKAAERGLPRETRGDLVSALFAGGLSTRDEVCELSGRGLGMSSLKEAVLTLGGRIEVESAEGRGTRLRCVFRSSTISPS